MIWYAIIYMVSYLLFLCLGQSFNLPAVYYHVSSILFVACTAVLILWAAYLDYKVRDVFGKIAFILFGLLTAGLLTVVHYHPALAQELFW